MLRLPRSQFVVNENLLSPSSDSTVAEEWFQVFLAQVNLPPDETFLEKARARLHKKPAMTFSSTLSAPARGTEPLFDGGGSTAASSPKSGDPYVASAFSVALASTPAIPPPHLPALAPSSYVDGRKTFGGSVRPIGPPASAITMGSMGAGGSPFMSNRPVAKVIPGSPPKLMSDLPACWAVDMAELAFDKNAAISKGTFGTVYKAQWRGRDVAVKLSHIDSPPSVEQLRNFERELNAYCAIHDGGASNNDPNVCRFYGACVKSLRSLLIVTEFAPRGNLFDLFFDQEKFVNSAKRLNIGVQLCAVVDRLHTRRRIIHRDLKTPNILLDAQYNIKLCDFGKARFLARPSVRLDDNGGSPRYMAPECYVLNGMINEKSDVWSLACCIIEIFGGPIPFEESFENEEVVHRLFHLKQSPAVPQTFHPKVRSILTKCFSWTPAERPSARELHKVLLALEPSELDEYQMNIKVHTGNCVQSSAADNMR